MFDLELFRIRAFAAGNVASLLSSIGRGGLQFMLIIWLQGIWLPLHGYNFGDTPLWAGIYMLPLTVGFLVAGPAVGLAVRPLRRPARSPPAALLVAAFSFVGPHAAAGQLRLPGVRASLLLLNGIGVGAVRGAEHHRRS